MPTESRDLIWKPLSELRITIDGEMQEGEGMVASQRPEKCYRGTWDNLFDICSLSISVFIVRSGTTPLTVIAIL